MAVERGNRFLVEKGIGSFYPSCSQTAAMTRKKINRKFSRLTRAKLVYIGSDSEHSRLHELDGSLDQTPEQKFALICALSLFDYQLRNNTDDIPRLLRTTACIRKP
jgi:hypothetical protein